MNTYHRHELQRHKKSDKIKWIATGVAFLLVALILVGVCLQLFGKGKAKPSEWFAKDKSQSEQTPKDNGGMVVTPDKSNTKMRLMSERATSSNSLIIKATVLPDDTTDKTVDFTAEWANPDSTWATGKTIAHYINIDTSETSDTVSAGSARVSCHKAFGEPIVIKATSRSTPDVSASVMCEYVKRVNGFTVDFGTELLNLETEYSVNISPEYSDGTLLPEITYGVSGAYIYDAFFNAVAANMTQYSSNVVQKTTAYTFDSVTNKFSFSKTNPYDCFATYTGVLPKYESAVRTAFNNAFKKTISTYSGYHLRFVFEPHIVYDGNEYYAVSVNKDIKFDSTAFVTSATSITTDPSEIIF